MFKPYHVSDYIESLQSQLVFSNSYVGLESYLSDLAKYFYEKKYVGNIIIDLLLSNGKSKNRYIQIYFDGDDFDLNSAKTLKANEMLKNKSLNYYAENPELLQNSVLNKSQAYLIKKRAFN